MNDKIREIKIGDYHFIFKRPSKYVWKLSILKDEILMLPLFFNKEQYEKLVEFLKNIIVEMEEK